MEQLLPCARSFRFQSPLHRCIADRKFRSLFSKPHSQSDAEYDRNPDNGISYGIRMTGLHPYADYSSLDGNAIVTATAGYGIGEVEIESDVVGHESLDSSFVSVGLSGTRQLFATGSSQSGAGGLSLEGVTWFASQNLEGNGDGIIGMRSNASHIKAAVKGMHPLALSAGSTVAPNASIGFRRDEKGQRMFTGMEISSGASFASSAGVSVSGYGLVLISQWGRVRESGLSGTVEFDSDNDQLGILVKASPAWGWADTAAENGLWNSSILEYDEKSALHTDGAKLDTEVSYGLQFHGGSWQLTPFGGLELQEGGLESLRAGSRISIGSNLLLQLNGEELKISDELTERKIKLNGSVKW